MGAIQSYHQADPPRLTSRSDFDVFDRSPDPALDELTELAAVLSLADYAYIAWLDFNRLWFKSRFGFEATQTARDAGLCSTAMLSQGVFHLRDAAHDERATGHSLVHDVGIRFYAGAPLRTEHKGHHEADKWNEGQQRNKGVVADAPDPVEQERAPVPAIDFRRDFRRWKRGRLSIGHR